MKRLLLISILLLSACLQHPLHQGNDLDPEIVGQIREGDTRFRVEKLLGSPVLLDTLHPHRAIYIEDFADPATGEKYRRKVIIEYDNARRVKEIKLFGFEKQANPED
jgi:outer membrane protein assembly factor BamE (lipoprotein component of BamABCDE complex)